MNMLPVQTILPVENLRSRVTVEELIAAFLTGLNSNTLRAYNKSLEHFAAFAGFESVGEMSRHLFSLHSGDANHLVLRYQKFLREPREDAEPLSPSTANLRINAIRSLVKLARTLGLVAWDIEVRNIKAEGYRDTQGCGEGGFRTMVAELEKIGDARAVRDLAIVRLLWRGLRRFEVAAIKLHDFLPDEGKVVIHGKGRTQTEQLTIPPTAVKAVAAWVRVRQSETDSLFVAMDRAHEGQALDAGGIYFITTSRGREFGVKRCHPHGYRHAAITAVLDSGSGIREAASFARHKKWDTTQKYDDNRKDLGGDAARRIE